VETEADYFFIVGTNDGGPEAAGNWPEMVRKIAWFRGVKIEVDALKELTGVLDGAKRVEAIRWHCDTQRGGVNDERPTSNDGWNARRRIGWFWILFVAGCDPRLAVLGFSPVQGLALRGVADEGEINFPANQLTTIQS
jgi:hypothetical protein